MARNSGSSGCIGGVVILGAAVWMLKDHPGWLADVVIVFVIAAVFSRGKSCDFCGTPIKRVSSSWRIDGVKKTACPECGRRLQREASKQGVEGVLGRKK